MLSKPIRLSVLKHIKGVIKKKKLDTPRLDSPTFLMINSRTAEGGSGLLLPHQPHAYTFPRGLGIPREPACGILFYESFSHLTSATPQDTGCQQSVIATKRGAGMPSPPITGLTRSKQGPGAPVFAQSPPALTKPSRREQIKSLHQRHIFSFLTMMTNFWFKVSPEWHLYPVW